MQKRPKLGKKESEACHLTPQCASRLVSRRGHIMMFDMATSSLRSKNGGGSNPGMKFQQNVSVASHRRVDRP